MKNLLLIPMFLIAISVAPFGNAFANGAASGSITSDTTYTIELARILEEFELSFYATEEEFDKFPKELKQYLKKED